MENARVDWLGAVLLSGALGRRSCSASRRPDSGAGARRPTSARSAAAWLLIGLFVVVEGRVAQPLIDLRVLRRRSVAATNLTGFLVGVAMFSSFLIMPQFAQAPECTGYGFGFSVTAGRAAADADGARAAARRRARDADRRPRSASARC